MPDEQKRKKGGAMVRKGSGKLNGAYGRGRSGKLVLRMCWMWKANRSGCYTDILGRANKAGCSMVDGEGNMGLWRGW